MALQQHSQEEEETSLSQVTVFPCCTDGNVEVVHIMWVRMTPLCRDTNHIVPLTPRGKYNNYCLLLYKILCYWRNKQWYQLSQQTSLQQWVKSASSQVLASVWHNTYMGTVHWNGCNVPNAVAGTIVFVLVSQVRLWHHFPAVSLLKTKCNKSTCAWDLFVLQCPDIL